MSVQGSQPYETEVSGLAITCAVYVAGRCDRLLVQAASDTSLNPPAYITVPNSRQVESFPLFVVGMYRKEPHHKAYQVGPETSVDPATLSHNAQDAFWEETLTSFQVSRQYRTQAAAGAEFRTQRGCPPLRLWS